MWASKASSSAESATNPSRQHARARSPAADHRAGRARINPRPRLPAALIAKLGRLRPDHLAHHPSRYPKLAANRPDRFILGEIRPTDLCDRLHYQHPRPGPRIPHGSHCGLAVPGVPIGCRSPRKRGPYSMPIHNVWIRRAAGRGGTTSSNPLCSSVESSANLTPTREHATEPNSRPVLRMPLAFAGHQCIPALLRLQRLPWQTPRRS